MNINSAIQWFYDRLGKVMYSMTSRLGPYSYDCSSSVYLALKAGGYFPADLWVGNTDSLFNDLEKRGWVQVSGARQRGDIFIWGKRGASGGSFGHTGIFVSATNILHCAYGYNGIHEDNHDWLWGINGYPEVTVYRYVGAPAPVVTDPNDQVLDIGSYIKFTQTYTADDVQFIGGIWQVQTHKLCSKGFTWDENGIPAEPLVEVRDGYATPDQELDIGSQYVIPGKFQVLDLGEYEGMWLAMIEWSGLKFWVDVESATEIPADAAGTPTPDRKPAEPPLTPQSPIEAPKEPSAPEIEAPSEPNVPDEPTPPINEPQPTNPKEDTKVAFSEEDRQKLAIQSERIQETVERIAATEQVEEIISGISKKTKLVIYLIGDTLLYGGIIAPQIIAFINTADPAVQAALLGGMFASSGTFLLTMFGIYKSGK